MMTLPSASYWPASRAGAALTIDLGAICRNYRLLQQEAAGAQCAAVVKADAYGLGVAQVGSALETTGAREFFVAHVDEGIILRQSLSSDARITVLHGPRPDAVADCVAYGLRPVLNTIGQISLWQKQAKLEGDSLEAVLQVDSGMSRFGLSGADVLKLAEQPDLLNGISTTLVMSHLACADDPSNPANEQQRLKFLELARCLPDAPKSLAASSGIFLGRDFHMDLVRPGAALYGIAPTEGRVNPLKGVVRLQARVLQIRDVNPGEGVGYGLTYRPETVRRIAIVAAGYADGFSRQNSSRGFAWLDEMKLPIVGRVSMDSLALDVSDVPEALLQADMVVDLIGPNRGVDDVAASAGTIGYEVLTSLGARYNRHYVI